ncbi:hypothetical protein KAI32_02140 [Candidatus Pacearchaeota archaeon]|nr:hypothetical protein [Candidatus Pacearchaeota archaeon]
MKNKNKSNQRYFLLVVFALYLSLLVFNQKLFFSASSTFLDLLLKIIPAFVLVFILITISNYFITPERVTKFSTKKGILKWLLMVLAGVLSVGPLFVWYPLLAKLKNHGLNPGLVATYIYSKAIVISFFPLLIFYFSLKYIIVLYCVLAIASIIQGILINILIK